MAKRTKTTKTARPKKAKPKLSVDSTLMHAAGIIRRGPHKTPLDYIPEITWLLFLRTLDETEEREAERYEALGRIYRPSLKAPYRWRDWAAPVDRTATGGKVTKRRELEDGPAGSFLDFVNKTLLPHLKGLRELPSATVRQRIISQVVSATEKTKAGSERDLCDLLDTIHRIHPEGVDTQHVFTLSQPFEHLIVKLGNTGKAGGQFFTPREAVRAMIRAIDPRIGETVYDPCCGTGGFLAQAAEHLLASAHSGSGIPKGMSAPDALDTIKRRTFYGREQSDTVYPIALANLLLHGVDEPRLWHGDTLTGKEAYGALFQGAPSQFDVILTNPPFGGDQSDQAHVGFDYRTSSPQILFLQHILRSLKSTGRCGMVIDEGVLFKTDQDAFVQMKRKLTDECDLWAIVSLPGGVFSAAGAGVKTDLLFFTKGKATQRIWYYDLSDIKVGKKSPLTLEQFDDFFTRFPKREESERSWTVDFVERKAKAAEAAQPFLDTTRNATRAGDEAKERLSSLKRVKPRDEAAILASEQELAAFLKQAREAAAKAEQIENAVYDLKAVNPNRKSDVDTRTPAELLDLIEAKGREVADALALLRSL
jgi:type I restriction enzyme M protein